MLIAVGMCVAAATGGVVMGYLTLRRAREEIDDCRRMLVRQASTAAGDLRAIRDVAVPVRRAGGVGRRLGSVAAKPRAARQAADTL